MDSNLGLTKELSWVLQLDHLTDIMMASLMVHLTEPPWDEKTELSWDLHMELQMHLNLGLMKELSWVL